MPKPPKRGRPKLPKDQVRTVITLRLTPSERREFEKRAHRDGLRLPDWIRKALTAEARRSTASGTGRINCQ